MNRITIATIALCCTLTLAGCSLAPSQSPDEETMTVEYTIQNEADATFDIELYLLPSGLSGAEVVTENGTTYTVDGTDLGAIDRNITGDAVLVRPLGEDMDQRNHALGPGEGVGSQFEAVPDEATLVTVLRGPGRPGDLRSWSASYCGAGTATMTEQTTIYENGSVASSLRCSLG